MTTERSIRNEIALILVGAEQQKWPYTKTFELLKNIGVTSYEVDLRTHHATYKGGFGSWTQPATTANSADFVIQEEFDAKGISEALRQHQHKRTNYLEFLHAIAQAGVAGYRVDMEKRTVTYYGLDEHDVHIETVP
jgi:uncharacterized protein YbcV (DUF1398 family)